MREKANRICRNTIYELQELIYHITDIVHETGGYSESVLYNRKENFMLVDNNLTKQ